MSGSRWLCQAPKKLPFALRPHSKGPALPHLPVPQQQSFRLRRRPHAGASRWPSSTCRFRRSVSSSAARQDLLSQISSTLRRAAVKTLPISIMVNPQKGTQANARAVSTLLGVQTNPDLSMTDKDAIFVCIDCEAWEFDQKVITEVGVAVLDTRKLKPLPTDVAAAEAACFEHMAVAHFLIKEHRHRVNRRFITGYPDKFTFGATQTVPAARMPQLLERLFQDPTQLARLAQPDFAAPATGAPPRNIVFVGHDTGNDRTFLSQLGFELGALAHPILCTADTQRVLGSKQQFKLRTFATALGFDSPADVAALQFLHNAGNDAAWTLKFLVAMALRETANPGSVVAAMHVQRAIGFEQQKALAKKRNEAAAAKGRKNAAAATTAAAAAAAKISPTSPSAGPQAAPSAAAETAATPTIE